MRIGGKLFLWIAVAAIAGLGPVTMVRADVLGYWPFDDPGDPAVVLDETVNGNDAVVVGTGVAYSTDEEGASGLPGDFAMTFVGGILMLTRAGWAVRGGFASKRSTLRRRALLERCRNGGHGFSRGRHSPRHARRAGVTVRLRRAPSPCDLFSGPLDGGPQSHLTPTPNGDL